jgi:hypothetical protein
MKMHKFVRGVAFAAALAITSGGLQAQTVSAMPRNPCQDYVNQARANQTLGRMWFTYGETLMNLGWVSQAQDAFINAQVFYGFAEAYVSWYEQECR